MLEYRINATLPHQVRQLLRPPAVYLDHWAFRLFSANAEMRQHLVEALRVREGTLVIGRLNLSEFVRVKDTGQIRAAEELLQVMLPRVFFIDIQIMNVVEREAQHGVSACGDPDLFQEFGRRLLENGGHWRASNLFDRLIGMEEFYKRQYATIEGCVLETMNEYAGVDSRMMNECLEEARQRPRATLGLARALVGEVYRDKTRALDAADASDMLHAVVPCAYCDFVLLDGEWCDYVQRAQRRLWQGTAVRQHIARVYSKRRNGVSQFLADLRAHAGDPRSSPPWRG